jgi:hypothetical protein
MVLRKEAKLFTATAQLQVPLLCLSAGFQHYVIVCKHNVHSSGESDCPLDTQTCSHLKLVHT